MSESIRSDLSIHERIVFRADASLQIGSGHIMRCLTLAEALRKRGAECLFICREHRGNLIHQIRDHGFDVTTLMAEPAESRPDLQAAESLPEHATWLGTDWQTDAEMVSSVLQSLSPDWLIVDHYALDRRWEQALRPYCSKMMVIDDLADRAHDCDLLLDQNLGRQAGDYAALVPAHSILLIGPKNALLRPEFAAHRENSLRRRQNPQLKTLLINMGGLDSHNATSRVLGTLRDCPLPSDCRIIVVMGKYTSELVQVSTLAKEMPWSCEVMSDVQNMAYLMANSDLAIGAAGGTSWERCVVGLPSLIAVIADNQRSGAKALAEANAAIVMDDMDSMTASLPKQLAAMSNEKLAKLSEAARYLVDGYGTSRVVAAMFSSKYRARPMSRNDLSTVLKWRNHPDIRRFMYTQHEISLAEHLAWYEHALKNEKRHLLIIEDSNIPLGFVQFTEQKDNMAEWGFYAAPGSPRGSGQKLGIAALHYGFHYLGFHKIIGEAIAFNKQSIALHRRLGFQENVLANEYFDGSRQHDVHHFEILINTWRLTRGS